VGGVAGDPLAHVAAVVARFEGVDIAEHPARAQNIREVVICRMSATRTDCSLGLPISLDRPMSPNNKGTQNGKLRLTLFMVAAP